MEILQGFTYHIKDTYFEIAHDENLMQNKEQGNYRPTLYCIKDESTGLFWMVPITSQYDKFATIRKKILNKGKPCRGIILGEYDGHKAAFLVQNMFPITEEYIDHIHTKNGNPVPVKRELQKIIKKNVKSLLTLNDRGIKVTFTDISRLRTLMKEEMAKKGY